MTYNIPALDKAAADFEGIPAVESGKRCGIQWTPRMGDWFTSYSPRNDNSNAEGPWDHWVDLAIGILQDDLTAIVRPEAHAATQSLTRCNFYSEVKRQLTAEELADRFDGEVAA